MLYYPNSQLEIACYFCYYAILSPNPHVEIARYFCYFAINHHLDIACYFCYYTISFPNPHLEIARYFCYFAISFPYTISSTNPSSLRNSMLFLLLCYYIHPNSYYRTTWYFCCYLYSVFHLHGPQLIFKINCMLFLLLTITFHPLTP